MNDAKQTKCPHCGSSFRISDEQLAAKGGSVRCGSCLQVFRADLHLVGNPNPPPAPSLSSSNKPKTAASDESWAHALIGEPAPQNTPAPKPDHSNWDIPASNKSSDDDDFGFSEDDISDFMSSDGEVEAPRSKTVLFDDEINKMLDDVDPLAHHTEDSKAHHASDNADESWAKDILSELEEEEQKKEHQQYGLEILDGKSKPAPKNAKLAEALGMGPRVASEPVSKKAAKSKAPDSGLSSADEDILDFLNDDDLSGSFAPSSSSSGSKNIFTPEPPPLSEVSTPVSLKPRRDPINWGHIFSWLMLCLVAVIMFIAQYTYFNFDTLAINPKVRPWFDKACQQFECRLPDIPAPDKLRVDDIIVRTHPKEQGALVVDAILRNTADFPQVMPSLRLRFSNAADEIVASRVLRPSEYLQGEARLLRRIPPNTPIRISLEIVSPGDEAINYGLEVVK